MEQDTPILNAGQVAELLGTHVETVRRLARKGQIPCFKVGKDWRFDRNAIAAWATRQHVRREQRDGDYILVVDDEPGVGSVLLKSLRRLQYDGIHVLTGDEGLAQVRRQRPMLILLDLAMPGMNGPRFLKALRVNHGDVPVAIITGYPDSELMQQAAAFGPVMLLTKPVKSEHLQRCLEMVIGEKRTEQQ
jgi:excisionase family DNA binding protein